MSSLKVIALISGGKDSLYSILHCLANGHDVVALGNLYPPSIASSELQNHEGDDINSFMYQTVGHSIIPLYEEALGIPLYREQILGSALNADKDYAPAVSGNAGHETSILTPRIAPSESQEQDETESLIPLLNKIIRSHPEATAVSTGAILSTYQRTRIESVAIRLGLVPLSYLWQYTALPPYSQSALLEDMAAVGQDARIIKVASGGLDSSFLWENVTDARTVGRLKRAMARFDARDGAVVGEGGEFETLAVDGPVGLWRKRIEVEVQGNVVGEGGTAIARLGKARAVDKKEGEANKNVLEILRRPQLLDKEFEMLMRMLGEVDFNTSSKGLSPDHLNRFNAPLNSPADLPAHLPVDLLTYHLATSGPLLTISNLTSPSSGPIPSIQLTSILSQLTTLLRSYSLTSASIISSTLLLRSMSSFTTLNPIYGAYFPNPIPPARVTVACGEALPDSVEVMLSVVVDKEGNGKRKRGLHVQSRSYWAPANIGPYSQAVAVPLERTDEIHGKARNRTHMVFMAGQIPLVPTTMQIMKEFKLQTTLALQHLWRIGRATDVRWWTSGVAFISNCGKEEAEQRALVAMKAWRAIHEALMSMDDGEGGKGEDEEMDIWDMKYRAGAGDGLDQFEFDSRPALPDYSTLELEEADFEPIPPCFVIQVDSLPRDADIEWTSLGLT
ncbi:adenine nucleotide alpha hydrolases-like protein, partial [Lepidopterella palustris CBS 459.81]